MDLLPRVASRLRPVVPGLEPSSSRSTIFPSNPSTMPRCGRAGLDPQRRGGQAAAALRGPSSDEDLGYASHGFGVSPSLASRWRIVSEEGRLGLFGARLRDYQVPAVQSVLDRLVARDTASNGAMLVAGCGTGKTVMSIAAACALGRKTAILCHNSMLITQWAERVEEFVGESPGVVQREKVEHDRPIVLFMIASVISGRYDGTGIFDDFGLVIVDECHHIAAKTFMDSLGRFPARARLGLTATPDRRDGLGARSRMASRTGRLHGQTKTQRRRRGSRPPTHPRT